MAWSDEELIQQLFPRLSGTSFEITSPRDGRYNCVGWAAGDTRRWWWPGESPFTFRPSYEKIAIFASVDAVPTHVARQLLSGAWTSKLGQLEDIEHLDVEGVGGTDYGEVAVFLRRRVSG